MSEASFVPLNDVRTMKRSNSVGSGSDYGLEEDGEHNTLEYRLHATDSTGSQKISLWHDVSLVHLEQETRNETEYFNFVCEIPKFSRYVVGLVYFFIDFKKGTNSFYQLKSQITERSSRLQPLKWVTQSSKIPRKVYYVRLVISFDVPFFLSNFGIIFLHLIFLFCLLLLIVQKR